MATKGQAMSVTYKLLDEDGSIAEATLEREFVQELVFLPDNPTDFFRLEGDVIFLELAALVNSRARPQGILNANGYMRQAANGDMEKRQPISVSPLSENLWQVVDGNSTVLNALLSGWSKVPCIVNNEKA